MRAEVTPSWLQGIDAICVEPSALIYSQCYSRNSALTCLSIIMDVVQNGNFDHMI